MRRSGAALLPASLHGFSAMSGEAFPPCVALWVACNVAILAMCMQLCPTDRLHTDWDRTAYMHALSEVCTMLHRPEDTGSGGVRWRHRCRVQRPDPPAGPHAACADGVPAHLCGWPQYSGRRSEGLQGIFGLLLISVVLMRWTVSSGQSLKRSTQHDL